MKIVLCGIDSFTDPKSWSGTHSTLFNYLQKEGLLFGTINYSLKGSLFTKSIWYFHRKLAKWFYFRRGCRDSILNKYYEKAFMKGVKKLQLNGEKVAFLHVTDYCIPKNIDPDIKHYVYIDSTIFSVLKYQNDKRWLKQHFSDKYISHSKDYLSRVDGVFTQNEWSKESVIEDYKVLPEKVHNLGFGINLKPLLEEKQYGNNLLIVLRRGMEHVKGLYLLLEAFKSVKKELKDASLFVVGTELEQQDGVEYYENYPREKTIELFSKSSLYVMPAVFEPNGITYLEGLANKSPIIGLNRCAVPEFAGYGKYGFILDEPKEANLAKLIVEALSDKTRLKDMGEAGQKVVAERYKWNLVIDNMIGIMTNYNKKDSNEN